MEGKASSAGERGEPQALWLDRANEHPSTSTAVTGSEEALPPLATTSGCGSPSLCVSAGPVARDPAGLQPRPLLGHQEDEDPRNPLTASECGFLTHPMLPSLSLLTPLFPTALGAPDCQDGSAWLGKSPGCVAPTVASFSHSPHLCTGAREGGPRPIRHGPK